MAKRHVVAWTDDERVALEQQEAGPLTRRQRYRVQILFRVDDGDTDAEIAEEVYAMLNVRAKRATDRQAILRERLLLLNSVIEVVRLVEGVLHLGERPKVA